MPESQNKRLHATIAGFVQGVGFRYFVIEQASNLNLSGWVRNTFDGRVEVLAEGSRSVLEKFLEQLKVGPPAAEVTGIKVEWSNAQNEFNSFNVLMSA
jgi:acylphosphatase